MAIIARNITIVDVKIRTCSIHPIFAPDIDTSALPIAIGETAKLAVFRYSFSVLFLSTLKIYAASAKKKMLKKNSAP